MWLGTHWLAVPGGQWVGQPGSDATYGVSMIGIAPASLEPCAPHPPEAEPTLSCWPGPASRPASGLAPGKGRA